MTDNKKELPKFKSPSIFVSEFRGFQPFGEDGKPICRFTPFAIMHPDVGWISKGHYVCAKEEIFNKLVNFSGFGKSYKLVKKLPFRTDSRGMIINRGVNASGDKNITEYTDEQRKLLRELHHLEAKYYTEGSNFAEFKANIKDETQNKITSRVNYIKKELGV